MMSLLRISWILVLGGLLALGVGCTVQPDDDDDDNDDASDDDDDDDATDDDDDATADDDDDDDATADDDDDDSVEDDSIYDLQGTPPADGTEVYLHEVVVTSPLSQAPPGFFVQEPDHTSDPGFSGIFVYIADGAIVADIEPDLTIGNLIHLTASFKTYYDFEEIEIDEAADVEYAGTAAVTPAVVAACDVATGGSLMEEYESVLVQVDNVTVSSENPDGPDNDYGEFEVEGCLRVDDLFHDEEPALGTQYSSIVGVMNYAYSNAKLEPRSAADLM